MNEALIQNRCEKHLSTIQKSLNGYTFKEFWIVKFAGIKQRINWNIFLIINKYRNFIFDLQTKIIDLVDPSYYKTCPTEQSVKSSVFKFGRYMNPTKNKLFNHIIGFKKLTKKELEEYHKERFWKCIKTNIDVFKRLAQR
jgi:hypothetical protein